MFKKRAITFIYTFLILCYLETALRMFTMDAFDKRFVYPLAFCIPTAGLIFILTLFKNNAFFKILYNVVISFLTIFFCVQLVYYAIFGGYLSLSLVNMGGAAITKFTTQLFEALRVSAFKLLALLIPIPATIILTRLKALTFEKSGWKVPAASLASVIVLHILCILSLALGGKGPYTVYDAYYSSTTAIDTAVTNLGVQVTAGLELKEMTLSLFGIESDSEDTFSDLSGLKGDGGGTPGSSGNVHDREYGYNMLDIDFDVLGEYAGEKNDYITESFYWRSVTNKNEYTGIFEGYNLISICAEAFCPYVIDEEMTPTLYKMSTEGFVFDNFYGSFESVTTDGEFAFCLSMFPDMRRGKYVSSFALIEKNALPYTFGNSFKSLGADTYFYHNNYGDFYNRHLSHPNLGYDVFKTPDRGLDMEIGLPSSDLDMMKASVDDYINSGKQFHTYYMTFSGHTQYTWENTMAKKNRDKVEHLDYSDAVKAYLAASLELEYALEYLVERLEEAGIADKTVIVLANDHYPYGLTDDQYSELAGKKIDTNFEKYKNTFFCWCPSMEEPVHVEKLCSTIDIVPTVLNLFGYDYDSRFIVGRDALSDAEGIAILANQSFITDRFMFDAVNNKVTSLTDEEITDEELDKKINLVKSTLGFSRTIIYSDYYKYFVEYLEDHPEVYETKKMNDE